MSAKYVLRRVLQAVVTLALVVVAVFLLVHLVPGDPARALLGERARVEDVAALREELGLDQPLPTQFRSYLAEVAGGTLGESMRAQRPVAELIVQALPSTAALTAAALAIAFAVGIPLGITAAVFRGSVFDRTALVLSLLGQSIPAFWLGLMLISVVAVGWGLLPTSGTGTWQHLVLPAVALAPTALGLVVRVTRISLIEVLTEDYVLTARAKGAHPALVVGKHALRNALIPVITIMGLQVSALVGGAVITETVFAWPGIGRLAVNSLIQRDYPVVQGVVLVAASAVVLINLAVDLLYVTIDRRVRYS